jgi:hypothetical protein
MTTAAGGVRSARKPDNALQKLRFTLDFLKRLVA